MNGRSSTARPLGPLLRGGGVYWGAMLLAGGVNLGFNLLAARALGPGRYGELAALLALVNALLLGVSAITRTVTTLVAGRTDPALDAWVLRRGTGWLLGFGAACTLALGLAAVPTAHLLHLPRPAWIWVAALALPPAHAGAASTGILQGRRRFAVAGAINLAAAAAKFALLLALVRGRAGVGPDAGAAVAEVIVVWLGSTWALRPLLRAAPPPRRPLLAEGGALSLPAALTVARLLFLNLDILAARHFLGVRAAGLFAALAVTGRIVAYGTGAIPPVLYPYLIRHRRQARLAAACLLLGLGATAVAGGAGAAVFYLAPGGVVRALFGPAFAAIAPYAGWYGTAFLLYSLAYVHLQYLLAARSPWVWAYALGGGALELAAVSLFHRGLGELTAAVGACFTLLCCATGLHAAGLLRRQLRAAPGRVA